MGSRALHSRSPPKPITGQLSKSATSSPPPFIAKAPPSSDSPSASQVQQVEGRGAIECRDLFSLGVIRPPRDGVFESWLCPPEEPSCSSCPDREARQRLQQAQHELRDRRGHEPSLGCRVALRSQAHQWSKHEARDELARRHTGAGVSPCPGQSAYPAEPGRVTGLGSRRVLPRFVRRFCRSAPRRVTRRVCGRAQGAGIAALVKETQTGLWPASRVKLPLTLPSPHEHIVLMGRGGEMVRP